MNKHATLQEMVAANLDPVNNTAGRPLSDYTTRIEVHPDGAVELVMFPTGFDYLSHSFGIAGNGLLTDEQLALYRASLAAAKAEREKIVDPPPITVETAQPIVEKVEAGSTTAAPTLGGVA